jgi:hypothetical protein
MKELVFRDLLEAWGVDLANWKSASPSSGSSNSLGGASSASEAKETTKDDASSAAPASEDCCFLFKSGELEQLIEVGFC